MQRSRGVDGEDVRSEEEEDGGRSRGRDIIVQRQCVRAGRAVVVEANNEAAERADIRDLETILGIIEDVAGVVSSGTIWAGEVWC